MYEEEFWFAWRPIRIDGRWVWWRLLKRWRCGSYHFDDPYSFGPPPWQYSWLEG